MTDTLTRLGSRAVERNIVAGDTAACEHLHCPFADRMIKFCPTQKNTTRVICNVYEDGSWARVEHYHRSCYRAVGEPWGEPAELIRRDRRIRRVG